MVNVTNKSHRLEILVATMNRSNLDFLSQMFPHHDYKKLNILIINQTTKNNLLESEAESIRVINSFNTGLPHSRNEAIKNASGDICLIADDDIIYEPHFDTSIKNAFINRPEADIITFQMKDTRGNLYRKYSNQHVHDKKSISTANSVVIAFKGKSIVDNEVRFNNNFGLGTTFETANEYVFLRNALQAGLRLFFEPIVILTHDDISSGMDDGSDKIVFARAALFYKYSGILGYLRLCKYLYGLVENKTISSHQFMPKLKVGFNGIKTYKNLVRSGLEKQ